MVPKSDVSIIVPIYNDEKYIASCLESVIGQTYGNWEVICIDDGSMDNSVNIVKEYQKKDARIRLELFSHNRGVSAARNFGLKNSVGKYIYFLDADDMIVENAILELVKIAERCSVDCIYFDSGVIVEMEGIGCPQLEFALNDLEEKVVCGPELFRIMVENNAYSGSVCRQFWNRKFLVDNNLKFEEGFLAQDALCSLQAILLGKRMVVVNHKYHIYRRRGGSMSTNVSPMKAVSMFKIYCRLLKIWGNGDYEENVSRALQKKCDSYFLQARRLYLRNHDMISEEDFSNPIEKHLFQVMLENAYTERKIDREVVNKIKKYNHVIVYGAGNYAVDVINALEKSGIIVTEIAVTAIHENTTGINNIEVYAIESLRKYRENAIVIFGVLKKNRKEIKEVLRRNGFCHYIELD